MLKQDLILRNPLRLLDASGKDILPPGSLGAVLARAGVGKTAFIIQVALNHLLQHKNVLHISLNEPVGKVDIWYQEVLGRLAQQYQVPPVTKLWDAVAPHRFIMTFRVEGFSAPKLEERLTDLTSQGIFIPNMIIVDGLPFGEDVKDELDALKLLARQENLPIWFTITTHRHEPPAQDGLPLQLSPVQDHFDVAITLQPKGDTVHIKALKGVSMDQQTDSSPLTLDPATMLIRSVA